MRLDAITVFIFCRKYSDRFYASVLYSYAFTYVYAFVYVYASTYVYAFVYDYVYASTYVYASVYDYVFTYQNYSWNHQAVNFSLFTTGRIKQGK